MHDESIVHNLQQKPVYWTSYWTLPSWHYTNLQHHLQREHSSKTEVHILENCISRRILVDRIFGSQRDGGQADDDHDDHLKVLRRDDVVHKDAETGKLIDWLINWFINETNGFVGDNMYIEENGTIGLDPPNRLSSSSCSSMAATAAMKSTPFALLLSVTDSSFLQIRIEFL